MNTDIIGNAPLFYYRYHERTGDKLRYVVGMSLTGHLDNRFYRKDGTPRTSILIKGKQYFRDN